MKFPWYKYEELPLSKRNTVQIFITNQCNLRCEGCFAKAAMAENPTANMSYAEYSIAVDAAIRNGAEQVNILGGEPLIHPKIDVFCRYNADKELKTTIYTNGTYLEKFEPRHFYGAKLRVSLDSFSDTKKAVTNLVESGFGVRHIDANYMITIKTSLSELIASANLLENSGCKVFFIFNFCEMANDSDFFNPHCSHLELPVIEYKNLVHRFLDAYEGNMEIHVSKRGVFESTKSLPHCKCKFANYFIGGKIIQCPYDIVNLKWQDDYEFDSRYCQQNSTCLMSKIKLQRRK